MNTLKVVHIVEALSAGIHSYLKDLARVFDTIDNVETTIIYSDKRKEIDALKVREDFPESTKMIMVPMQREIAPFADIKSYALLKQKLKEIQPDVVHLHSSKAGVIGRIAASALKPKPKIYYTPHGYSFLRKDVSPFTRSVYRTIEKSMQKLYGGVTIACGDTEFEYAKALGSSRLVRNGVNFLKYEGVVKSDFKEKQQLTVGIVGRITAPRRPELFNRIAEANPQFNFVWVGDGELRDVLVAKNIKVSGWFYNSSDVLNCLKNIDIYIQTSAWEGLPIALLEAMALKIPVLATNVVGNKDVIRSGENGYLFKDEKEASVILKTLSDFEKRSEIGMNGYLTCKERFNSSKNFKNLAEVYQNAPQ